MYSETRTADPVRCHGRVPCRRRRADAPDALIIGRLT
jgi:hypothetical protein